VADTQPLNLMIEDADDLAAVSVGMRGHGLTEDRKSEFLVLLAVTFEPREPPSGFITLSFAGGATLMLQVECIDGGLVDIGAPWRTANRPRHAN